MRILRKLRENGNTDKLEWRGKKCVWKWRRVDDIKDSEDSDDNEEYEKIKEIVERKYSLANCCNFPGFHFTCLKNRNYSHEGIGEEKVKKDEGREKKVAEEESDEEDEEIEENEVIEENEEIERESDESDNTWLRRKFIHEGYELSSDEESEEEEEEDNSDVTDEKKKMLEELRIYNKENVFAKDKFNVNYRIK